MKIKKDDNVIILAGKDKGKTGKVTMAMPKEDKVIVSGINVMKKHQKPRKQGQKGQTVEKSMPIHVSNVMLESEKKTSKKKITAKK
ncbi:MAG TPA: 50S ribosomal protein L24 [Candidatus Paceibacterota bacterium]